MITANQIHFLLESHKSTVSITGVSQTFSEAVSAVDTFAITIHHLIDWNVYSLDKIPLQIFTCLYTIEFLF